MSPIREERYLRIKANLTLIISASNQREQKLKRLIRVIGLIILILGRDDLIPSSSLCAPTTERDALFLWRRSSGPHGERNPTALPLYEAVFAQDQKLIGSLLDRGISPNLLLYPGGWSSLMVAIAYNDQATVRELVSRGADMNYLSNDRIDSTPLAVSLSYGRFYSVDNPDFAILHYLLDAGADINVEYYNNDIALDAVTKGRMAIVNELLARGFHHNLPRLKKLLDARLVDDKTKPEKEKAIATVNRLLK